MYSIQKNIVGVCLVTLLFINRTEALHSSATIALGARYKMEHIGGYRLEAGRKGASRIAYSVGPIAVSNDESLLYAAGHSHHFSVGAFSLATPPKVGPIDGFPIAPNTIPFVRINPPNTITNTADRIMGLEIIDENLLVMTDEYYDANTNNKEHLVIFKNRYNLLSSEQLGFFSINGSSHLTGWMGKIPEPLSSELKAIYLSGSASNIPINGRLSIGPSLYTWFPFFLQQPNENSSNLQTTPLLNYSLKYPLHNDLYNKSGNNNLWTEVSRAVYGFITPDQKRYLVLGSSGGHKSKVGYKIKQKGRSKKCHGPCAYDPKDYYNYFWLYDVSDLKRVVRGEDLPHELRPVEYGTIDLPLKSLIIGADFNHNSSTIYLMLGKVDKTQSKYESQPVILLFKFQ